MIGNPPMIKYPTRPLPPFNGPLPIFETTTNTKFPKIGENPVAPASATAPSIGP